MSGIIVSVIVPFLESNNKLIDTLSSISEQKNINQENIEVLIVDATDKTSGKIASGSMSMCKVIYQSRLKALPMPATLLRQKQQANISRCAIAATLSAITILKIALRCLTKRKKFLLLPVTDFA